MKLVVGTMFLQTLGANSNKTEVSEQFTCVKRQVKH